MTGLLRIIRKDFEELVLDPRAFVALIILPSLMLVLVGQLRMNPERIELLVANASANAEDCTDPGMIVEVAEQACAREVFRVLGELSNVEVSYQSSAEVSPLARMQKDGFEMVLNYDGEDSAMIYIAETDARRLPKLLQLAEALRLTTLGELGSSTRREDGPLTEVYRVGALGGFPMQGAHVYYPQSLGRELSRLPSTVALIVCFLPFIVAAPSLLREREAHTLEVLLSAPKTTGATIFIAKCVLVIIVSVSALLLMLVVMQTIYDLYIKSGLIVFLLFLLMPMLSATFLGLAVSSLSSSQTHVVVAAALYFLLLNLFGGFYFVPSEGSSIIQALSALLPLTFTMAPANAWLFGAPVQAGLNGAVQALLLQTIAYGMLAVLSWRYRLRRI